jgi:cyclopropane-fatty-acyl-phospholipid synthase
MVAGAIPTAPKVRAAGATRSRAIVERILDGAGIRVDGPDPWDLQVRDERFFDRVLVGGTLGFGESYMDGWWDCAALDQLMERALRYGLKDHAMTWQTRLAVARLRLLNLQSTQRSRRVAEVHYDVGNDFYARMLGPTMTYSCGYWRDAASLDEAQDRKHDLVCDKLGLERHHRLLDIGSGWGRLLAHAHRRTGCHGTGVTVSEPQWRFAKTAHGELPVAYSLVDYRDRSLDAAGPFDRIASVGMFEHVGARNWRGFFARASQLLADDGLLLVHTMGNRARTGVDPWIDRYIFPNSAVPCARDLAEAFEGHFVLEDWHVFGDDYDRTLMAWARNFEDYARTPGFPLNRRAARMWRYYLYSFAGSFRARNYLQLWQVVLSKKGTRGGYRSVR